MENYKYGFIGNCTSGALINSDCSIDWLCLPFFDSPSIFGKLLDEKKGGYFKISSPDIVEIKQDYVFNTAIFRTTFITKSGTFMVDDYMPRFKTLAGEYSCQSEIQRYIRVISGKPKINIQLKAMPNYALSEAQYKKFKDYIKIISQEGDYDTFYLYTNLDFDAVLNSETIQIQEDSYILLAYHEQIHKVTTELVYYDYQKTKTYWMDWVSKTTYPPKYKKEVLRSAITLKMLTYQKSGAVLAALTTSLPEIIGRDRNWDYRYCWIRDGAMMIDVYARIGHKHSATNFMNFILNRMPRKHESIRVMYGINGEVELDEKTLDHLAGHMDSKPVRIGNLAYIQKQNDLYGELIETIYTYFLVNKQDLNHLNEEIWTVVRSLVRDAKLHWKEKDSGIWERRADLEHYVHSKLMNWVAFDRAIKIAQYIGKTQYIDEWKKIANEIKNDILKNAWNEEVGAFTMYYGSNQCDAANLLMLHYGFLEKDDPRIISTVKVSYKQLVKNDYAFRYLEEDEFGTPENTFIVCSFWMINALYLIGEKEKANKMFDKIVSHSNKFGLYAEDIDPKSNRLIGNFPQGYSHLAFIQTALLLETDYNWSDAESTLK